MNLHALQSAGCRMQCNAKLHTSEKRCCFRSGKIPLMKHLPWCWNHCSSQRSAAGLTAWTWAGRLHLAGRGVHVTDAPAPAAQSHSTLCTPITQEAPQEPGKIAASTLVQCKQFDVVPTCYSTAKFRSQTAHSHWHMLWNSQGGHLATQNRQRDTSADIGM